MTCGRRHQKYLPKIKVHEKYLLWAPHGIVLRHHSCRRFTEYIKCATSWFGMWESFSLYQNRILQPLNGTMFFLVDVKGRELFVPNIISARRVTVICFEKAYTGYQGTSTLLQSCKMQCAPDLCILYNGFIENKGWRDKSNIRHR